MSPRNRKFLFYGAVAFGIYALWRKSQPGTFTLFPAGVTDLNYVMPGAGAVSSSTGPASKGPLPTDMYYQMPGASAVSGLHGRMYDTYR